MARRRFQRGSVFLRGRRNPVWVGRWREDRIIDGKVTRVLRKETLGTKDEFPTKRLAMRELETRLAPINNPKFRPQRHATFAEFSKVWETTALPLHKPSTQSAIKSNLRTWLNPNLGPLPMNEITGQTVQELVCKCDRSAKTRRNLVLILKIIWKSAKAWEYAVTDPFAGLTLPKLTRRTPRYFSVEQVAAILSAAEDPYRTFYWIAAETGLRAGELCGLMPEDINLQEKTIHVQRSIWQGKVQTPKSSCAVREFAISDLLAEHLKAYLSTWKANKHGLLFVTRRGFPWSACNVLRANLHPLLQKLEIDRCGLHAFRHTNGSLMDRLNAPMKIRQERLGHAVGSDVTMRVYTHSVTEDDRRIASQLGAILRPFAPTSQNEFVVANQQG